MATSSDPSSTIDEASAVPIGAGPRTRAGVVAQVLRGFSMGSADLVPGVSGGTIALVFGIYDELIAVVGQGALALGRFAKLDPRGGLRALREVHWLFLMPLLGGVGLAIVTLAGPLEHLLENRPVVMSAAFFGLIVASVFLAEDELERWDAPRIGIAVAMAALTFVVLGLRGGSLQDPSLLVLLAGGALAVCAMILPGISGSFILLMVGLYQHVLDAVNDRRVLELLVFTVGAVIGLGLFSSALKWLLARYRATVIAALIGLMVGSLRVLWPWPAGETGVGDVRLGAPAAGELPLALAAAVVAGAFVIVVARLGLRQEEHVPIEPDDPNAHPPG